MTSQFIISLDFELMWGVRDHRSIADYGASVLGVRQAIPRLLKEFRTYGIEATWATVGLLFARNQREMVDYSPKQKPGYHRSALSPYQAIADLSGQTEDQNPYFFGRSLVDQILEAGTQEMSCHTYSHYFCLEPGQNAAEFKADISANIAIAKSAGAVVKTIVFPRNQWAPDYVDAAAATGLIGFRGNQGGFMYKSRSGEGNTLAVRGLRLLDGALPITERTDFAAPTDYRGMSNIPASRFLRPWKPKLRQYNALHIRRIKNEMTRAAKAGTHYHLWWHPHNMGCHTDGNFAQLENILRHYRKLHDQYGMQSSTMLGAALAVPQGNVE